MILPAHLLAAGYKAYASISAAVVRPGATTLYQRWFFDDRRRQDSIKLYALNWWSIGEAWVTEARLYQARAAFTIELCMEPTSTIKHVEQFYRDTYRFMGCVPDRHNND